MSGQGSLPAETEHDRQWRALLEERRAQVESFTWSVPGLAVAGQAFILSIALRPDVTSTARLLAAGAGVAAAIATFHLYAKQVYLFDLYEGVIESERQRLGQHGLQLDELKQREIPKNTSYRRRRWSKRSLWRNRLIVRRRTAITWLVTLMVFVGIDLFLLVYALLGLLGVDPGWLANEPTSTIS